MNDIINLLPDSVANQIAAGEVIPRPAAAVKELVENAVDAGADSISLILKDAGRTLIQVIDNGKGMSQTDARMAFERHATSKIKDAADLFDLHTMGFRGEALASICAIAQIEMTTKRTEDELGTCIRLNGSQVESQEPTAAANGTNLMVKNLFFNQPARRKFLKSDSKELAHVIHEFERLALVNPNVSFEFYHNDTLIHKLLKGSLKDRIGQLFGRTIEKQLIPINVETPIVKIDGFVGLPEHARKRNWLQYLFVNGRNIRHPYFHKAVMTCFENLIANDAQPNYFLNFTVEPSSIDVNIHPTKNEVKFENEQAIWQILMAVIRESLGRYNVVPSIDFNQEDSPEIPVFDPGSASISPTLDIDTAYNPFEKSPGRSSTRQSSAIKGAATDWEGLYKDFESAPRVSATELRSSALNGDFNEDFLSINGGGNDNFMINPSAPVEQHSFISDLIDSETEKGKDDAPRLIQLKNRYIISPSKSGLTIIDRHRAHVLVLYSRYLEMVKTGNVSSQKVIFPEVLTLTASQNIILDSIVDKVAEIGFEISFLGDNSWAVNGVPSLLGKLNPIETLTKMIDNVAEGTGDVDTDLNHRIALAIAKASAVTSSTDMTDIEVESLLSELFSLPSPGLTPDGLTIVSVIGFDDISRLFN
ncbi:MAG: DNA mismatch repair endonuclease MutL [Muribaculaceae bacterium]|nr:DNA mismatch repair endonuclease MutL [Muribaculaceae bacterium]